MENIHYQQTQKLAEKATFLKKLNKRVEEKIEENIEKYFRELEDYPNDESEFRLENVSNLLSLNWKLNKNIVFVQQQVRYYASKVEAEKARA